MDQPRTRSYWIDTAPAFKAAAQGAVEGRVDVAVVGAGFTGLSAALALARGGAGVAVLEADSIICAASGRNGGHCNSGLAHDYVSLAAEIGADRARAYYRAFCDAVDHVEHLVNTEVIECDFRRCGRLKLAQKPEHFGKLAAVYEALHRDGVDDDVTLIGPGEIRKEVASSAFHGGLLQHTSAQLHVGKFGVGLSERAAGAGARIYENAQVLDVTAMPSKRWRVRTQRGALEADQVLLATGGAPQGATFGWFRRRIISVGSFVIVTEPLDPILIDQVLPGRRNYATSKHIGCYFRTTADDRLVFGGRARFATSDARSDALSGQVLRTTLGQIFPQLCEASVAYCWGGMVDLTSDRLPRAGARNGIHYAMGYSGHGVQMSVYMGSIMAEVISGRHKANPWADLDWPAVPAPVSAPWFLPMIGAYYRMLDTVQ